MAYQYKAFISYRHCPRDSAAAKALHTSIEHYIVPKEHRIDGQKRLGKVFRDEEELRNTHDLTQTLRNALDASEFLIVICSPESAQSPWVRLEVAHFLSTHTTDKLLTVLTGGDSADIFPKIIPECPEPLYLDLSGGDEAEMRRTLKGRFLKLCATLVGCEYDELVLRHEKRRRRQILGWSAGVAAVLLTIAAILLWANISLKEKNEEILLRESTILTERSADALAEGDRISAVRHALDALPSPENERPYYAPAEAALWSALDVLNTDEERTLTKDTVLEQFTVIFDYCISADGRFVTTIDGHDMLNCFDAVTGERMWTVMMPVKSMRHFYRPPSLYPCPLLNSIIVKYKDAICRIDQNTGKVLWSIENVFFSDLLSISSDGRYICCITEDSIGAYSNFDPMSVTCISTEDGTILSDFPLTDSNIQSQYYSDYSDFIYGIFITDQDSALSIVHKEDPDADHMTIEKYNIRSGNLIWCSTIQEKAPKQIHMADTDGYCLLGMDNRLSVLDSATGEELSWKWLGASVVLLEPMGGRYFSVTTADGACRLAQVDSGEISFLGWSSGYPVLDSATQESFKQIAAWHEEPSVSFNGDPDAYALGACFMIGMPRNNSNILIVKRATQDSVDLKKDILFETNSDAKWLEVSACNDEMIAVQIDDPANACLECFFLDRRSGEILDAKIFPYDSFQMEKIRLFPDGTGGLFYNAETGDLCSIDLENENIEVLLRNEDIDQLFAVNSTYSTLVHRKLNREQGILTLVITDQGMKLWINDEAQPDALYPDTLKWSDAFSPLTWYDDELHPYYYGSIVITGSDGYILMNLSEDWTPATDQYYIYSVYEKQWHTFPIGENDYVHHISILGESTPIFTVMDNAGLIRTYDIQTGKQIHAWDIGVSSGVVTQIEWIMNDRYLSIITTDAELLILDGSSGEILCRIENLPGYSADFESDKTEEHLYIWGTVNMCIDLETWTPLTTIPNITFYDPVSDSILYKYDEYGENTKCLISYRLPTTNELIELGRQFLGE